MKLTSMEAEIVRDRLEVPDAIHNVLEDSDEPYTFDEVNEECDRLRDFLPFVPDDVSGLRKLILVDAVQGSTRYVSMADCVGHYPPEAAAVLRAGRSLADKIGSIVGMELTFPKW